MFSGFTWLLTGVGCCCPGLWCYIHCLCLPKTMFAVVSSHNRRDEIKLPHPHPILGECQVYIICCCCPSPYGQVRCPCPEKPALPRSHPTGRPPSHPTGRECWFLVHESLSNFTHSFFVAAPVSWRNVNVITLTNVCKSDQCSKQKNLDQNHSANLYYPTWILTSKSNVFLFWTCVHERVPVSVAMSSIRLGLNVSA